MLVIRLKGGAVKLDHQIGGAGKFGHADSLTRLRRARPQWDEDDSRRADIMIADISVQIREIDEILRPSGRESVDLDYPGDTVPMCL